MNPLRPRIGVLSATIPAALLALEVDVVPVVFDRSAARDTPGANPGGLAHAAAEELAWMGLHGFVLRGDAPAGRGQRRFADALRDRLPNLPIEDEVALHATEIRAAFLERVASYARWQRYVISDGSVDGLVAFHGWHTPALRACAPGACAALTRLVAGAEAEDRDLLLTAYEARFMAILEAGAARVRERVSVRPLRDPARAALAGVRRI